MAEAVVVMQTLRWGPLLYPVPGLSLRGSGQRFPQLL